MDFGYGLFVGWCIGWVAGALWTKFCFNNKSLKAELDAVKSEFKSIHERLITVIAEWQKKV
jgi:uncharacterized membrane-anchored protein YhcB (DUF1043 family)